MKIVFRVDGSPLMGGGHVMRCLTLADVLAARGAKIEFVSAALPNSLAERVRRAGHGLHMISLSQPIAAEEQEWELIPLTPEAQREDALRTLATTENDKADWVVVDHYGLSRGWEATIRGEGTRILVIDDLANRQHSCDVLLDQTYNRLSVEYSSLVPPDATILTGAEYALLRPEFRAARPASLERRRKSRDASRVLISLGMTDIGAMTESAMKAVGNFADIRMDIVMGAEAPTLPKIRKLASDYPNSYVHVDPPNVASLMLDADIAIGSAGTTTWERCCLGLPTITLAVAANQRNIAANLEARGAIYYLPNPDPDAIGAATRNMVCDPEFRARLVEVSASICDGDGTNRVANSLMR